MEHLANLRPNGLPLFLLGSKHFVRQPPPDTRTIGGNRNNPHSVNLGELAGGGHGRAGHAGQVLVPQKEILHGDAGGLASGHRDFDLLFGLNRLMNAVPPFASLGQTARVFIDDHNLAVLHHVLPIQEEIAVHLDRPLDVLIQVDEAGRAQDIGLGHGADELPARAGELDFFVIVIVFEVFFLVEAGNHFRRPAIHGDDFFNRFFAERPDDERRACFVDENAVRFVHQAEMRAPLHRQFAPIIGLGGGELA